MRSLQVLRYLFGSHQSTEQPVPDVVVAQSPNKTIVELVGVGLAISKPEQLELFVVVVASKFASGRSHELKELLLGVEVDGRLNCL